MPTPRRRLTAEQRRELIEQAATELFAEHGYRGASIDAIVKRAGVTPPVFYDHFASKEELHRALLAGHYEQLRGVWMTHLPGPEPQGERFGRAFDAWFAYVEAHPVAARMIFRQATGDPGYDAVSKEVADASRVSAIDLVRDEPGGENLAGADPLSLELAFEIFRVSLQGLALWWLDHQDDVSREQIVRVAMNALWVGFERVSAGETWSS